MLLVHGADVNMNPWPQIQALRQTSIGVLELSTLLLSKVEIPDRRGRHYASALQASAAGGKTEVVQMLLEKGAGVNTPGGIFGSALQAASFSGSTSIVEILLAKGALKNSILGYFGSALEIAYRHENWAMVDLLRSAGAKEPRVWASRDELRRQYSLYEGAHVDHIEFQ